MTPAHNTQLHRYADQVGTTAASTVDRAWTELWRAMRPGRAAAMENYHRARALLAQLPRQLHAALRAGLGNLFQWAYDAASVNLIRRLPQAALQQVATERRAGVRPVSLLEDDSQQPGAFEFTRHPLDRRRVLVQADVAKLDAAWSRDWGYIPRGGGGAEIAGRRANFRQWLLRGEAIQAPRIWIADDGTVGFIDGRHRFAVLRDLGVTTIPVIVERRQVARVRSEIGAAPAAKPPRSTTYKALLFPPLPAETVQGFLGGLVRETGWRSLGDAHNARSPDDLANLIAARYAAGDSTRDVAAAVLPYFDGSRVRATRAARTFGTYTGTAANLEASEQVAELVAGYEVRDPGGPTARPDHAKRSGTRYWRSPQRGQYGLDVLPQPPLDRGGPNEDGTGVKWNCRCWLQPVLVGG